MANYKVFADDDKKQGDGTSAVTATSTVIDGGTAAALGTAVPTGSPMTANLQLGGRIEVHGSQVIKSKDVFGAFQAAAVTLTSVADDGNGFCDFTLASHGLSVGDVFNVEGSTSGNVDGVQKITAVPDVNSIVTDKAYTASATAGTYQLVNGRFASMTVGEYLIRGYSLGAANVATMTAFGNDYGIRRSIHKLEAMYSRLVATSIRAGAWNIYTGVWSTDPVSQDDAGTWGTDHAATPTRAIPGELTYRVSGQPDGVNGPFNDDYQPITNG